MCGCKCVIAGKGVVNSWHHGLSLSLSLCPRRTWQRVLKLEDRHDITHALIYTISSIFNWRIWFAERQTWVNERERQNRSSLFIARSYLGDYPSSLSLISVRDRHETERQERERERERNSTLWYQDFPWTWTSELALFLSLSNFFALFLSLSTHTRRTRIHREEIIEIHRETRRREGGRERDEIE